MKYEQTALGDTLYDLAIVAACFVLGLFALIVGAVAWEAVFG